MNHWYVSWASIEGDGAMGAYVHSSVETEFPLGDVHDTLYRNLGRTCYVIGQFPISAEQKTEYGQFCVKRGFGGPMGSPTEKPRPPLRLEVDNETKG